MIDVYNAVLQLAGSDRGEAGRRAIEQGPISMPERQDLIEAVERALKNHCDIADSLTDPTLTRSLLRISEINDMVREHARQAWDHIGSAAYWPDPLQASCGEMPCPECKRGTLCYLVTGGRGAFVECSTVGCIYWDSRA